jgi:GntR family transcriptional regulator
LRVTRRELASELMVNPRTVLHAYQELEREGVVYVKRGQGTFVAPDAHPDRQDRLASPSAAAANRGTKE